MAHGSVVYPDHHFFVRKSKKQFVHVNNTALPMFRHSVWLIFAVSAVTSLLSTYINMAQCMLTFKKVYYVHNDNK